VMSVKRAIFALAAATFSAHRCQRRQGPMLLLDARSQAGHPAH
jgi:hypothetical protein